MILLFALFATPLSGQTDSLEFDARITADTILQTEQHRSHVDEGEEMEHSAKRALYYSLFVPGLGQVYNKKYFKIPIVYVAYGVAGYAIYYNSNQYQQAKNDYEQNPSSDNERYLKIWRRYLEMSYIGLVGVHALQVLDAYVDANLFYWDVDPDLTVRIKPSIDPLYLMNGKATTLYGLTCKLTF